MAWHSCQLGLSSGICTAALTVTPAALCGPDLKHHWQDRDHHNSQHHQAEVLVDRRHVAKCPARAWKGARQPGNKESHLQPVACLLCLPAQVLVGPVVLLAAWEPYPWAGNGRQGLVVP